MEGVLSRERRPSSPETHFVLVVAVLHVVPVLDTIFDEVGSSNVKFTNRIIQSNVYEVCR